MAMRHDTASSPDRRARLLLAAVVALTLVMFVWLVSTLATAAFRI